MENQNQIVAAANTLPAALSEAKLKEFLDIAGVGRGLPEDKRRQFIEIAQAYRLNPFKREIYCISYGNETSIITGYEVYIKRAERTGKLDGWNMEVSGTGDEMKAVITIYRNDWKLPFKHEVYFNEAATRKKDGQLNSAWTKMPRFMLKKVAIAQGFRLCFADELGGMPYTNDEIGEETVKTVTAPNARAEVILQLPEDALLALGEAVTKADLKQICLDVEKALGADYRPALNQYYREHSGALG